MNTEEVLIFLLALASGVSLFVGLAQALDGRRARPSTWRAHAAPPARRRHSVEAPRPAPRHGGRIFAEAAPAAATPPVIGAMPTVIETMPQASEPMPPAAETVPAVPEVAEAPAVRPAPGAAPPMRPWPRQIALLDRPAETVTEVAGPTVEEAPPAAVPVMLAAEAAQAEPAAAVEPPPVAGGDLVGGAMRLLKAGSHDELLALLELVLKPRGRGKGRPQPSHERALLWAMAGLASRARGDDAATRAAFERGLRDVPRAEGETPDGPLMPAAEWVGGRLLAGAETAPEGSASSLAGLRLGVAVLRAVATAQPDQLGNGAAEPEDGSAGGAGADELPSWGKALRAHLAVEQARDALAAAAGRRLGEFLGKRDHVGGYRWLNDALAWNELGERRRTVEDAYWKSVGGEVVRLTGEVLAAADDLPAATETLRRAEAVVQALPEAAARSSRMDEIRRRLWWSHTKLGVQRIEMNDVDGALGPLYDALRLADGDPDRETETRRSLAQALEAMAAGVSEAVEERLRSGDRTAAEAVGQELCGAIDRGLAEGVSQEELAGALATRQHVMERIAQADGA